SFTAHSLGAQKLDKLGTSPANFDTMDRRYRFSKRIAAERIGMSQAFKIFTSTSQERLKQYAHPLYAGVVDVHDDIRFTVAPPGVNTKIFNTERSAADIGIGKAINEKMHGNRKPSVLVSSRLDEKKHVLGVVEAYARSRALQEQAMLAIFLRGIDDPDSEIYKLHQTERSILQPILDTIKKNKLSEKVFFFNIRSQQELAASYKHFASLGSVFALTAYYEPFGLALIEAAACGLAVVATKNGGPSEIFADRSGILIDPFDTQNIAAGLFRGIKDFRALSKKGMKRVASNYSWQRAAEVYLNVIREGVKQRHTKRFDIRNLNASQRLKTYLEKKEASTRNP
ncbi:MAG: glycosyltransferase, partial [Nitrospiria bacterium]